MNSKPYLTLCSCGNTTTKQYAKKHGGKCKPCITGVSREEPSARAWNNALIIDHGYDAYAREEGHYDIPDNY